MKNNILFMLITGSILLFSCGTAQRASYASSDFVNGIYYVPNQNEDEIYHKNRDELYALQNETTQYLDNRSRQVSYDSPQTTQTVFVGDTNVVDIEYNPNYNYAITDDTESFLARLRKYDSPSYNINIEFNSPYSYWHDSWYRPYWASLGTGWYNPYWGMYYSWWGPSYYTWNSWYYGSWYDPWYYGSWYNHGWYDPWYGWHNPWHHPHYWPGYYPGFDHPFPGYRPRDIYYGQRTSSPSYNAQHGSSYNRGSSYTRKDANMSQIRGNRENTTNPGTVRPDASQQQGSSYNRGSAYRRVANTSQNGVVYNNSAIQSGNTQQGVKPGNSNNSKPAVNNGGSMYRRSASKPASQSVNTQSSQSTRYSNTQNSNNSYRNSNNSGYNRNSSSYSSGGSSQRSSGSSMSTGSSHQRSGGSSYRR